MPDEQGPDIIEHFAPYGFSDAIDRLTAAIERAGLILFARIDHAKAAADVGLSMPPTTVLLYGGPKGGTPLMLEFPTLALDLPLRVLVRVDADGRTVVAFHPASILLRRAGVPDGLAGRLDAGQRILVESLQP